MESIIRTSVLFFIAFALPTNEINFKATTCTAVQEEAPQKTQLSAAKTDGFWLTKIFVLED